MPVKPDTTPDKVFYSIGEVAELFDVNASLIRFWEKEFDILKPQKNKKGNRLFTPADVENIKLIYYLVKERGFTIDGARKRLKGSKDETELVITTVEKLRSLKAQLQAIKAKL